MQKFDFDFLKLCQIFGDNQLEIFKKYGIKATITDFAILLGGLSNVYPIDSKVNTGLYFTKHDDGDDGVYIVDWNGDKNGYPVDGREVGCRPVLTFSQIEEIKIALS